MGSVKRKKTKLPGVYEVTLPRLYQGKPDKAFYIVFFHEGRHHWEKVGTLSEGYDEKAAEIVRQERLRSIRHEDELPQKKKPAPSFKKLAEQYLEWATENKSRAGLDDRNRYQNHLSPRFDKKRLNGISSFDLERMKSELLKDGLAPATVRHCLVLVRQMFNKAKAWGLYAGENPVAGVKLPVPQNARERFLSHQEADTLLKALVKVSRSVHDMALLSLHSGMRAGEIFDLRGSDLDFENGLITVRDPKNKQARKAYMTPTLSAMLKARIPEDPEGYVFPDRVHGGRINIVSQTFRKTVEALGFNKGVTDPRQKISFHSMRHTFGSWLAIQGTPILTISQLMGHKTLSMAARYAHLSPDHKRDATLNLEKIFNQKVNGGTVTAIK